MSVEIQTVEEIAQHIKAMGDSVMVVNRDVVKPYTDRVGLVVKANVEHLKLMLAKDFVIADGGSKTSFTTAVAAGQTYLDANE